LQVIVLTVRNSQDFRQKLNTSMRASERHATFICLSKLSTLFDTVRAEKLQEGREGRPLEPFREGAGDRKHVPAKKQSH
jgi:hypothetical protein